MPALAYRLQSVAVVGVSVWALYFLKALGVPLFM